MRYYVAERTQFRSPEYKYFSSIDEINAYYYIDSTIDDYNCGYCFPYKNIFVTLGYEE